MSTKSLQAFKELLKDDKRTSQRKEILLFIKEKKENMGFGTDLKTLWLTYPNMRQSAISARVSELHDFGMIKFVSHPFFNQSLIYYVSDPNEQESIRKAVESEKRANWLKKGLSTGYLLENDGKIELALNIVV